MKFNELKEKKVDELGLLEDKLRKELAGVRMEARMGSLKNTARIGEIRKDIARVLTSRKLRLAREGNATS